MKNDLNSLIAHYQEKFDRIVTHTEPTNLSSNKIKSFLASTLHEAITQAFLATKVDTEKNHNYPSWEKYEQTALGSHKKREKGLYAAAYMDALTKVEEKQKVFLAGK